MELDKFDAYLIFASGRFTENDSKLADKVHSIGKTFFFVRAKIDVDLRNAAHDQGLTSFTDEQEHKELLKIRKDCLKHLKGTESNLVDVYLISNHSPKKWDLSRLTKAICLVMLTDKAENLGRRISKVDLLSHPCPDCISLLIKGQWYTILPLYILARYSRTERMQERLHS